jgi:hypothetical protein
MSQANGQILRLVGLAIEMVCLILWIVHRGDPRKVGGISLTNLLFAGVVLGFVLWLSGRVVIQFATAGRKPGPRPDGW